MTVIDRLFGAEFFIAFGIGALISGGIIAIHSYSEDFRQFLRNIM